MTNQIKNLVLIKRMSSHKFNLALLLIIFSFSVHAVQPDYWAATIGDAKIYPYSTPLEACDASWEPWVERFPLDPANLISTEFEHHFSPDPLCGRNPECGWCRWTYIGATNAPTLGIQITFGVLCRAPVANPNSPIEAFCRKEDGPPDCSATGNTNPINIFRGSKYQQETDYVSNSNPALNVTRSYFFERNTGLWQFNQRPSINIKQLPDNNIVIVVRRPNVNTFGFIGTLATGFTADSDIEETLVAVDDGDGNITGWQLTLTDDRIEEYDAQGQILTITRRDGVVESTFTYDDVANTITVTDHYGDSIVFRVNNSDRVDQFIDPDGQIYTYTYGPFGRIGAITYPDDTPANNTDNPKRIYHYENTRFPTMLTGITDENGNRFVSWTYDDQGRATSSEHGNIGSGIDLVTIDYTNIDDETDPRVTVTNPLGKPTTYHYDYILGVRKTTLVEGHATPTCAAANQSRSYDENGFLSQEIDWEGNTTNIINDTRGLQTSRTEAAGTPEERTITTEWHPQFRLPTKITEPGKETTFTYDGQGRLLSRTEREI